MFIVLQWGFIFWTSPDLKGTKAAQSSNVQFFNGCLKSGLKMPFWYGFQVGLLSQVASTIQTSDTKMSSIQINSDFGCLVFGSPLYIFHKVG